MSIISTPRRKFSKEKKLSILKEASQHGVTITLKKYGVYLASYYVWRKKLHSMGEEGLDHAQLKKIRHIEKKPNT